MKLYRYGNNGSLNVHELAKHQYSDVQAVEKKSWGTLYRWKVTNYTDSYGYKTRREARDERIAKLKLANVKCLAEIRKLERIRR